MSLNELTIAKAHDGLVSKKFSAVELTEAALNQIRKKDKEIHAFLTVTEGLALRQARKIDKKIQNKEPIGPLAGIPMAVKDIISVEDVECTAGSKILENYIAPYDATAVKHLKKSGAVIVGKTNQDEFGMGSSGENSAFGPTKNPFDLERVAGGSSSGSAAAIAAEECLFSLGSDTGGSVRLPASFCGLTGLKPTYGRISRYGLIAFASSLDTIGLIAKTAGDIRDIFETVKGKDEMDSTSMDSPNNSVSDKTLVKDLKIGLPKEYFVEGIDPEVEKVVRKAIAQYESLGAQVTEVSLPHTEYALPCYYIIMPAEASANLSRYDSIKYGLSVKKDNLLESYFKTRQQGFGDEVRRRIMIGTYVLSAGYYDAYYLKAQKVRTLIRHDFDKVFEKVDVLMAPTSPFTAFKLGEKTDDPISMYLSDIYTAPASLSGLPSVSVPCGEIGKLPVGLQIIGQQFDDEKILQIAGEYAQ
jgi:aspartyl-tRNA(Asn)/glutamyl-tRNA(Gln) amidotransferase subunit A